MAITQQQAKLAYDISKKVYEKVLTNSEGKIQSARCIYSEWTTIYNFVSNRMTRKKQRTHKR